MTRSGVTSCIYNMKIINSINANLEKLASVNFFPKQFTELRLKSNVTIKYIMHISIIYACVKKY